MIRAFSGLVSHGLMRYADFDFTDEAWEHRRIGTRSPHILVFTEKEGWIRLLRKLHDDLGISTLALSGTPSRVTSEYTAGYINRALAETASAGTTVRLIGLVDYDPSGAVVATALQQQLEASGLTPTTLETVIGPADFTAEELRRYRYVPPRGRYGTARKRWFAKSRGIDGELYGLSSDVLPYDRADRLIRERITTQV